MIRLYKSILVILFLEAYNYLIGFKLGGGGMVPNILNIFLVLILLFLFSQKTSELKMPKGIKSVKLFFLFIFISFLFALVHFELKSSIPTFLRFFLYFLCFLYGYSILNFIQYEYFYKNLVWYIRLSLWFAVVISFYQITTGDLQFGNMIYRVSGPFYLHASGFSLFLVANLGILYALEIRKKKKFLHLDNLLFLLGTYILLRTGSRAGFVGFSLVVIFDFLIRKAITTKGIILIPIIIFLGFELIPAFLQTQSATRIRFLIENGKDASTMTRENFIQHSLHNFDGSEIILGKGLGSFASFYNSIEDRRVAAHNNFLQFYIEGGLLGLLSYTILVIYLGYLSLFELHLKNKFHFALFFLILNIEGFGLLNNNFYYPVSEFFVWFFLGLVVYDLEKKEKSNLDKKVVPV